MAKAASVIKQAFFRVRARLHTLRLSQGHSLFFLIPNGDPQKLVARIAELEATVESLRQRPAGKTKRRHSVQDLRRLTLVVFCLVLALCRALASAEIVTWILNWFPGGSPTSSEAERLIHMSAAKDALIDRHTDILCLQEVRDWESVAELVSVLPSFQPLVVSRFREFGGSGPVTVQQIAIASRWRTTRGSSRADLKALMALDQPTGIPSADSCLC